jgi:hypothetical protein
LYLVIEIFNVFVVFVVVVVENKIIETQFEMKKKRIEIMNNFNMKEF